MIPTSFVGILLLVTTLTTEPVTSASFCDGKADGTYVNPTDPNKFYQCVENTQYDFSCPKGMVYYESTHLCGWPYHDSLTTDGPDANTTPTAPATTDTPPLPTGPPCKRRVCYFTNWAQYRRGAARFNTSDIDLSLCTHINYAFAQLIGNTLAAYDNSDETLDFSAGQYEQVTNMKNQNPDLKVLLAVGGWVHGSKPFHQMVATADSRSEFVNTTIQFLQERNFDGLDLDWEYPANRGSPPEDRHKFTLLVQELRQAFDQDGSGLLLTTSASAGKATIDTAYEIPAISKELDFINMMGYDLHGSWESVTGHDSPLYARSSETGWAAYLNVDWAANYWVQKGCPKEKLVVGLPLYGRSFTLSGSNSGVGAPASIGIKGLYTGEGGFLSYYEICEKIINKNLQRQLISDQRAPYVVDGDQWIGYDDESSLREKTRYVRDKGFGGIMVWAMDLDDFSGQFCGKGKYPLLNAIKDECLM